MSTEIIFEAGDLVAWKNPDDPIIVEHGPGPFLVTEVIPVSKTKYACGTPFNDTRHDYDCDECTCQGMTMIESTGHSQLLIIQKDGEAIKGPGKKPQSFSGYFFIKTDQ